MAELRRGPRPTDAAIIGMGAVFPGAADLAAYRRNLLAGTDAIGEVPPGRWDPEVYYDPQGAAGPARSDRFYCRRGGFVDGLTAFEPTRFGIMPTAVEGAEPDQMLALHATAEAVADAGGEERLPADRSRIGVVLGRGGFMGVATARLDQRVRTAHQLAQTLREVAPELGEDRIAGIRAAFQTALGPERPDASIGLVPSFTAARTANRLDFRGPAYTLDAACASSLLAVDQAVGLLAGRQCDVVVAGAVHHCHIATLWSVFTQLRALSPSERIRPFDRRADGTLLSEGTGVVLLKRLADAERDGDRIYAVVRGTGVAGDGRAASLMSPLVDGQVRALERAWRVAGLDPGAPDALGLLEAHGTGTPVGDAAELETLARVFGDPGQAGGPRVGLGSVKSMLGHTMQASGMAGLIKAALAVHTGVLLPTLHVEEPHEELALTRMRLVTSTEPWERGRGAAPRRAGVNAFGFGGINAHAVLEEAPGARAVTAAPVRRFLPLGGARAAAPGPGARDDVLLLAADTPQELAERLAARSAGEGLGAGVDPSGGGPCRLAVIGPTPQRLALAAKAVARGRPWRGRGEVWFTAEPLLGPRGGGGRVAVLFPGLEPEFAPALDDVADRFGLPRPRLTGGGELVERALDAIAVGRFSARVLGLIGIEADLLAGHSLGEWAAMVVAGMYPEEAVDRFLGSLRPDSLEVPDLVYAALGCGSRQAEAALHGLDGVVLSHDNCPHQSVVCGAPEQVRQVLERLRGEGVLGQEMPFRSGFHTPMWEPYLGQVRGAFGRLPLRLPPSVPVWSATTGAAYPAAPEEVRALVVRHLLEPVDFRGLTLRLYEEAGVRAFVAAGPGSLPGFVEDTLRGREHVAVATSGPRHSGLASLRRTAAALWTEGLSPHWPLLTPAPPAPGPRATAPGPAPAPAEQARRRAGVPVPLDLGSPLVRLGDAQPGPRPSVGSAGPGAAGAPDVPGTASATRVPGHAGVPGQAGTPGAAGPAGPAAVPGAPGMPGAAGVPGKAGAPDTPRAPSGATRTPVRAGWPESAGTPARPALPGKAGVPCATRAPVVLSTVDLGSEPPAGTTGPAHPSPGGPAGSAEPSAGAAAPADPGSQRPAGPGDPRPVGLPRRAIPGLGPGRPADAAGPAGPAGPSAGAAGPADTGSGQLAGPGGSRRAEPGSGPGPGGHAAWTDRSRLRLSLRELPYVRDHCVYQQPEDWPEDSDRFPVVPMTTMLELAADAARRLHPGGTLVGFDDVRALRWLAVEPATEIEVTARPDGPGRVRVALGDCAVVVVLFAERHDAPPPPDRTGLRDPGPAPVSAEALYRDRWMFHGPGFAGVHEVSAVGADGIRGVLRALPAPGALLDAAGQLFGHWMQLRLPVDRLVFPASVDRIRFHAPPPAPGSLVHATARIREVRDLTVRGDVELTDIGNGGAVWARIDGWTYRRFAADERVWPMKFTPEVCGIGEPQPGGWCAARRRWTDPASQELVMRRYLGAAERTAYERLSPRARPAWLLGRIAAKDALRQLLWEGGAGPVFPAEVPVGNDPEGRPVPQGPLVHGVRLSLAHKDRVAVALAHRTHAVGIDVEAVTADPAALVRVALGPGELRLAERVAVLSGTGPAAALTALWCAKEAAAKAEGSGIGGRPRDWTVVDVPAPDSLLVVSPGGRQHLVRTSVLYPLPGQPATEHIVAWTEARVPAPAPAPAPSPIDRLPVTETSHGI
ncbi:beta-ketoacyl synthase N-terminal-like domain-containing protein [Streptomyces sp. NPDC002054]|uniref:type I polyketide synthase n=1 Tax=Streptomyces sp. NPDC002054 TaxID=3154663 RepID=UPI00332A245F